MTNGTEIEAKFFVNDLDAFRAHALTLGAQLSIPRLMESNLRFDHPNGDFKASRQVLRLRQDQQARLTFKRQIDSETREEIEITVDDFKAAQAFLEALGFEVIFIYEKYRETYELNGAQLMLDELPFGNFVEVEGPTLEVLRGEADALGLLWEERIFQNYHALFEELRVRHQLPFRDATFENFKNQSNFPLGSLDLNPASHADHD